MPAIATARPGLGRTRPNPTVGCVLVKDGLVLAESATGEGGRPHAEEQALRAAGAAAAGATAYVTLEPCGERTSATMACSDRLIAARVARVVIACGDPTLKASGRGLVRLRDAGIAVEVGLLADEALVLCKGFLLREHAGRPLVAESLDGRGFEDEFTPADGEDVEAALRQLGAEGYTRVWVKRDGATAVALRRLGLLDGS